jgi:hypothetical protein
MNAGSGNAVTKLKETVNELAVRFHATKQEIRALVDMELDETQAPEREPKNDAKPKQTVMLCDVTTFKGKLRLTRYGVGTRGRGWFITDVRRNGQRAAIMDDLKFYHAIKNVKDGMFGNFNTKADAVAFLNSTPYEQPTKRSRAVNTIIGMFKGGPLPKVTVVKK